MAKASISSIGAVCAAFLNKPIRFPDLIMEIRKIKNRDAVSDHLDVHGIVSPSWFSSNNSKLAEDGGMGIADYSPHAENLCAFSGVTPTDNQSLYSECTNVTEKTDQEVFGGSNESLAEKLSLLLTDHLPGSDCSVEENDVLSINSLVSNEAEAFSQDCSPLKNVSLQISDCGHSYSLNTEECHVPCGGEALADELSSISEIVVSLTSIESSSTTSAASEIFTPDNISSTEYQIDEALSNPLTMKPPNILVFTGEDPSSGTCLWFNSILRDLQRCINNDRYVIYPLTTVQILRDPWFENATLLVVSADNIADDVMKQFSKFIENGGRLFICCSPANFPLVGISSEVHSKNTLSSVSYKSLNDTVLCHGPYKFNYSSTSVPLDKSIVNSPCVIKVLTEKGLIILSEVHVEGNPILLGSNAADTAILKQSDDIRLSILKDILLTEFGLLSSGCLECEIKLTPGHLFTKNKNESDGNENVIDRIRKISVFFQKFFEAMKPSLNENKLKMKNMVLNFIDKYSFDQSYESMPNIFPIFYGSSSHSQIVPFDTNKFFSLLTTKSFGNVLIYSEVMTSTMSVIESLSCYDGCVVIAGYQTHGKGRTGNKWLSPKGCALFSLHFSCSLSSLLGQKLPFVQHLASLALVHGVRKITAFQDLNLRLKWPNDVYYGSQSKIGGVIVNSSVEGKNAHFYVGCGINVSNNLPTSCINEAVHLYNIKTGQSLHSFAIEDIIAYSLNEFEKLVEDFQKWGESAILPLYYSYWLHENQRVTINADKKEATIVGLDDYGFLMVETDDGQKKNLQPNGNSFDMMKNLISTKS